MQYTSITCCLVVGGLPLQSQAVDLQRRPDIVVCTPGRMIDHVHNSMSVDLDASLPRLMLYNRVTRPLQINAGNGTHRGFDPVGGLCVFGKGKQSFGGSPRCGSEQ